VNKPAYTCCDNPDPAILEKNGRLFCRSCRSYLDKPSDGARPTASPDIAVAGGVPSVKKG